MSKFYSKLSSREDFNLDCLLTNDPCRWKLYLHHCCVRWSTSGHGITLLKCPIGSQDVVSVFESHWKHFTNVSGKIDRSFLHKKMTIGDTLFQHTTNQTITFSGNIRYCFAPVLLSASTRLIAHIRSFWHLQIPSMSNSFSSKNRIVVVSSLFENIFIHLFLFSLCSPVSSASTSFFYRRQSRSSFNIRRTLIWEIFSWTANFQRSGDVDNSMEPLSQIILQHRLTVGRHSASLKWWNIFLMDLHLFRTLKELVFANLYFSFVEETNSTVWWTNVFGVL